MLTPWGQEWLNGAGPEIDSPVVSNPGEIDSPVVSNPGEIDSPVVSNPEEIGTNLNNSAKSVQ